jgi:hypothetical protein
MSVYRVGGNKSSQNVFPSVRPTLDLDFANSKTLDPRITFTRASGGSYVGADGLIKYAGVNEARFDHDPVTGESLGLLVEESRTNITPYSRYASGQWTFSAASLGSTTKTGVDGTEVSSFLADETNLFHRVNRNLTGSYTANSLFTFSFYVAKPSNSNIRGLIARVRTSSGGNSVNINVSNNGEDSVYIFSGSAPFGSNPPQVVTSGNFKTELVGNKWTRISIVMSVASVNTTFTQWDIGFSSAISTDSGVGGINSQIFIDSVQLEVGAFPTSYIPTQASTRTRAADNASITGKNFSEWYRQDEGTIFAKISRPFPPLVTQFPRIFNISGGTDNNRIQLAYPKPGGGFLVQVDGNIQINITTSFTETFVRSSAGCYKLNDFATCTNGTRATTATSGLLPIVDRALLGGSTSASLLNGHIRRLTYFPKRLPNEQLIALTR